MNEVLVYVGFWDSYIADRDAAAKILYHQYFSRGLWVAHSSYNHRDRVGQCVWLVSY